MDEQKLKQILESHGKWLRGEEDGERANLREANLYGANLYGAALYEADLYEADLRGADLREADLYGANLYEANLYEADLRGADLREADLYGANLREANLYGADLCGANLRGANLYEANLREKIIQVGPIGSRKSYTIYWADRNIVQCGCWRDYEGGSLAEFKQRIDEVYPEDKPETLRYRREYLAAIAMFEMIRGEEKHNEANP